MASPAAPTIPERTTTGNASGEPPAPVFEPVRRDSFPDVALGITRDDDAAASTDTDNGKESASSDDAGTGAASAESPASSAPAKPGAVVDAGTGTETPKPDESGTTEGDETPALTFKSWDEIKATPEYQRETATALNKQRDRLKQELQEAENNKKLLEDLKRQQDEYDSLVEAANDDSDPVAQVQAQTQLTQHIRATRLNEKIMEKLRPTVEASVGAAIATSIGSQYEEAYKELEPKYGAEVVGMIRHDQFNHGGDWLKTLVGQIESVSAKNAVDLFRKTDMEPEIKARVAEEVGKIRAGMPMTDLSEGTAGGRSPDGSYATEQDVHNAIADGRITAARGRGILQTQFGRRFR